ncbi:hypothetical protein HGQ17_13565 [Nesterenkonia sp. MY13]|uniref:Type II secretion system protein GspF domain-containing protein n=1 Tax=Nesterenkonia sedimenti TaxID=1463632 RepID=A0A7X8YEV9_9MICC|nr:hypothetical protein [Nesterenkonia sedimenti]NLS11004.1 hypothetical protein [Nesterenkonia sedimenti]
MSLFLLLLTAGAGAAAVLIAVPPTVRSERSDVSLRLTLSRARSWVAARLRPRTAQTRKHAAELLRQFSALLVSGRGEGQAWADLRNHWHRRDPEHPFTAICTQVAASEQAGTGTAHGLRRCLEADSTANDPELSRLVSRLLAVTALSEQTGAPLSGLVEQLAESLDDAAELAGAVETATAGPKLTQLILTLLPVGGVALGQIMGAQPLSLLLGGGLGLACLTGGMLCLLAGRAWSQRMIQAVNNHV